MDQRTTAATGRGVTAPPALVGALHRLFGRGRHPAAERVAGADPTGTVADLGRRRHCVVVTYRRDGTPVPTPVWVGSDGSRVWFRAEGLSGKAKRLRRNPSVRVAPCTARGRPLGPPFEGTARIVEGADAARAEAAIQRRFGLGRRLYERWFTLPDGIYVEVTPRPRDHLRSPP